MPVTRFSPFWLTRVPAAKRAGYDRYRGETSAAVVIVGGGLTGCATAYALAAAGIPAVLLEADRLGQGGTAGCSGLALQEPCASFRALSEQQGLKAARSIWQASRRATLDLAATVRRLGVRCDLDVTDCVEMAERPDDERGLNREAQARRAAGLDASWLNARASRAATGTDAVGGIKTSDHAALDPYRACLGFARAATERGALLYERSAVQRIRARRHSVEVRTAAGSIDAGTVIIATGDPTADFRALRRHVRPLHRYFVLTDVIPPAIRRQIAARIAIRDRRDPPHEIRWTKDDRLLVAGADQPRVSAASRPKTLVQRTGQLMYELSVIYPAISGIQPAYGWDAPVSLTADGVPCLGLHRNYPRHLFALGMGRNGPGFAYLASRLLLRACQDAPAKGDEFFAFSRLR